MEVNSFPAEYWSLKDSNSDENEVPCMVMIVYDGDRYIVPDFTSCGCDYQITLELSTCVALEERRVH